MISTFDPGSEALPPGSPVESGGAAPRGGILSPLARLTELLYGIILVLTFTGTLRVAVHKGQDLHTALRAAVGCCLAWAIVDAAMYVFNRVAARNRSLKLLREMRAEPATARQLLADSVPVVVARALSPADWDKVASYVGDLYLPERAESTNEDLLGAAGIFLLANVALLPLAAPFALMHDVHQAQLVSNGAALVLLFAGGFRLAHETGERPLLVGLRFLSFGLFLVGVTLALGG